MNKFNISEEMIEKASKTETIFLADLRFDAVNRKGFIAGAKWAIDRLNTDKRELLLKFAEWNYGCDASKVDILAGLPTNAEIVDKFLNTK